jgi:hypothetical protein
MSNVIFDPELVIARLSDQVPALIKVSGAADFAACKPDLRQVPAAFVVPLTERPGDNSLLNGVSQRVTCAFGVIIAVQNLRDVRGQMAQQGLREIRLAMLDAVLGWQPASDYNVCQFGGGRVLQMNDQVLWWQDDYYTQLTYRRV